MIRSMTGFGAGQVEREGLLVKAELRSVNHRFFDPSIRISREFGKGIGSAIINPLNDAKGLIPRGLTLDGLVSVWQASDAAEQKP